MDASSLSFMLPSRNVQSCQSPAANLSLCTCLFFFSFFFSFIYLFTFDRHLVGNEYFNDFVLRQDNLLGAILVISQPIFIGFLLFSRKLTLIKIFKPFRKLIQKRHFSAINFVDKVVHKVLDCGSAVEAEESDLKCIFPLGKCTNPQTLC